MSKPERNRLLYSGAWNKRVICLHSHLVSFLLSTLTVQEINSKEPKNRRTAYGLLNNVEEKHPDCLLSWHFREEHEVLRGAHGVADEVHVLVARGSNNVVDGCRVVQDGPLFEAEGPKLFAGGAGIEVGVIAGIRVAANVDHPHVETCLCWSRDG